MTIYCGVDFHARQQTVAYCDDESFETVVGGVHDALLSGNRCETLLGKERGRF